MVDVAVFKCVLAQIVTEVSNFSSTRLQTQLRTQTGCHP